MKRLLILLTVLIALTLLVLQAQAQQYRWGLPQTVQTPVVLGPQAPEFPSITPRRVAAQPNLRPLHRPMMRPIRKVTWPESFPILMPAPLIPTSNSAPPMYAVVDTRVLWQKTSISLHNDQLSLSGTSPVGEFGIAFIKPDTAKIRYGFTMQQTTTESLIPPGALTISNTVFVAPVAIGQPAATPSTTPFKFDWQWGPSHRIDAICLRVNQFPTNLWLSPAIVANWMNFQVTATTTTGTITAATETFDIFRWGGGLEAVYQQNNARLSALVAGSDRYLMADAALAVSLGTNLDLSVGWQGKQVKMERDTTARLTALALGLMVRF